MINDKEFSTIMMTKDKSFIIGELIRMVNEKAIEQQKNEILREALEYYSYPLNYVKLSRKGVNVDDLRILPMDDCEEIARDTGRTLITGGKKARQALKKLEGLENE